MKGKKTKTKVKPQPYLKLKALRTEHQLTAEKLAGLIGIAESTYRRKENRYQGADFYANEMLQISKIFETAPEQIFFAN